MMTTMIALTFQHRGREEKGLMVLMMEIKMMVIQMMVMVIVKIMMTSMVAFTAQHVVLTQMEGGKRFAFDMMMITHWWP